jgi:hypothetical protein
MQFEPNVAVENKNVVRGYTETRHAAGSWHRGRRVLARIEATPQGLDVRDVVTSLEIGSAGWIHDGLYCARGQAEPNQATQGPARLRSHRRSPTRSASPSTPPFIGASSPLIPKPRDLATAEFNTIRLRLLKIAAGVIETATPSVSPSLRSAPTPTVPRLGQRSGPTSALKCGA